MRGFSEILAKKQALDAARPMPADLVERVADWFERELLCQQDAMAEAPLGRDRIGQLLAEWSVDSDREQTSDPAVSAVLRHRLALSWVARMSWPGVPALNVEALSRLHRIIDGGGTQAVGVWRSGPPQMEPRVRSEFERSGVILPHHSKIELLMRGFGAWLETMEASPETALEAHFRLARIQPFMSENLTLGRLVMNAILGRAGYPPIVVPASGLETYLAELAVALVEGDKSGWRAFLMPRLGESLDVCLVAAAKAVAERQVAPERAESVPG